METQDLLEIARGSVDAFNDRDWDRLGGQLAPNAVYDEVGTGRRLTGRDEILGVMKGWTRAFPDVKGTVESAIASKDRAVIEVTYRGTHKGELPTPTGPVAPSGERMVTRCVQLIHVADGLIKENRNYFDMLNMLQGIGAIPTAAAHKAGA